MKSRNFLLIPLLSLIAVMLPSCSSQQSADAGDLIATVPADASMVAVANINAILEKAGCKVDGSAITPPEKLTQIISRSGDTHNGKLAATFFNGKSGVDPSVAVLFRVGYYTYATGIASDPAALKKSLETDLGYSFTTEDGIQTGGNVAIADNRFWINIDQHSVDPKEIRHFLSLDKTQSFTSNDAAERLCKFDKDIVGWGSIAGLLNTSEIAFEQRALAQVALQTVYEDPASLTFSVSFEKGKTLIEANVLNSKGSLAKYLFPVKTIDTKTIESIGGTADAVAAISIPAKMIERLQKDASSKGPSVFGVYLNALSGLDGTTAVAFGQDAQAMKGIVSTTGRNMAALTSFLGDTGIDVRIEGKNLRLSKGDLSGKSNVSDLAAYFKNAVAGVATAIPQGTASGMAGFASAGSLTFHPQGNSVTLRATLVSANPDENFLFTLVNTELK